VLRLAFCGTAEFSVPSLRALVDAGHRIAAVVTQPDRPGDRGRPAPRPVADVAAELGLPLRQPARIRDADAVAALMALSLDALVVAAYGQIIPVALLEAPRLGGVNVHGSLLPRHRGAAPVAAAILAGDTETGVSIMRMEAGLDIGPVWATRSTPIREQDTAPVLTERIAEMGAGLLVEVLARLEREPDWPPAPQDDALATYAPRLKREDGRVDWTAMDAAEVDRRVRALQPWPGVTAPLAGLDVRILEGVHAGVHSGATPAGGVVAVVGTAADMATAGGVYRVMRVQPPGRRPMDAAAYLRGRR
jgi:methionyl-tRNA formyltransferase